MEEVRVAVYTRVSTLDQSLEGQEHELVEYASRRGWIVSKIYRDKISGLKNARPALDEMLADARRGKFTRTLVWRIDRLGRSVSHLLEVLEALKRLHIQFVSLSEAIDTSTPTGMVSYQLRRSNVHSD